MQYHCKKLENLIDRLNPHLFYRTSMGKEMTAGVENESGSEEGKVILSDKQ